MPVRGTDRGYLGNGGAGLLPKRPPDTTVTALFHAAQKDAASGKLEQAAEEYKHVLRLDPDLIEARVNLGLTYHSLGQYKLAIEELEKAPISDPTGSEPTCSWELTT